MTIGFNPEVHPKLKEAPAKFFQTPTISCQYQIEGDTEPTPFQGCPEDLGNELLRQKAAAVMEGGNPDPKITISMDQPKNFSPLSFQETEGLAKGGNKGLVFLAVNLGLADYGTLKRLGFKISR
jgi:hypothetical protein